MANTAVGLTEFSVPARGLEVDIPVGLWTPPGFADDAPLPLLVSNDGSESDKLGGLTEYSASVIAAGLVPAHRVALVEPVLGYRDEWYSASPAYDAAMAQAVLPAIREHAPVSGPVVGMGASLGALAMLSVTFRHPGSFDGLYLQSGSFHRPGIEEQTEGYPQRHRVAALVGEVLLMRRADPALDIGITCGNSHGFPPRDEGNMACNVAMAVALAKQGHRVEKSEFPGGHNFYDWGKALHPRLTALLANVWGKTV